MSLKIFSSIKFSLYILLITVRIIMLLLAGLVYYSSYFYEVIFSAKFN